MDSLINILVTITNGEYLIRVALKIDTSMITPEEVKYALEPENKEKIKKFLPKHCSSFGNIVAVE